MRDQPFLDFHRTAEAAGYPAMLIVSVVSLTLMVAAISLVAVVPSAWTLVLSMVSLVIAVGLLAGAFNAAFRDNEGPADEGERAESEAPRPETVVPLPQRDTVDQHRPGRKAA